MDKYTGASIFAYFMTGVKILLSLTMLLGGVSTALSPVEPLSGALGLIFSSRYSLVAFGIMFFTSGLIVLYGILCKKKVWVGRGLATIYLLSFFSFLLELAAFASTSYWLDNLIISAVAGICWLWWKVKTQYLSMRDIRRMRQELQRLQDGY